MYRFGVLKAKKRVKTDRNGVGEELSRLNFRLGVSILQINEVFQVLLRITLQYLWMNQLIICFEMDGKLQI